MIVPGKEENLKIAIIGAGRLGTTLGYAIAAKGHKKVKIVSVSSPSRGSIERASAIFGGLGDDILFTNDNQKAARIADTVFICTPDDTIYAVCRELYDKRAGGKKTAVHFSGSKPLSVLQPAKEKGCTVVSIHPLKSFASIEEAIKTIKGTEYGVTYTDRAGECVADTIVGLLEGNSIFVKDESKPIYHAAACIASNYLVALIDYAVYINERIGIEPQASTRGLLNLIEGTVKNIKKMGTKKSLTGPIARGDTGTIKDHLNMFRTLLEEKDTEVYRLMGRKTADLARENGWIGDKTYRMLTDILKDKQDRGREDDGR